MYKPRVITKLLALFVAIISLSYSAMSQPPLVTLKSTSPISLPDTIYPSVDALIWEVDLLDSLRSPKLVGLESLYEQDEILTFRATPFRDMPLMGRLSSAPTSFEQVWSFTTGYDERETDYGIWGGGVGWTGQPLYVTWDADVMQRMRASSPALTLDFATEEVIVGSLCGKVYFINPHTGRASREPLDVGNPIKGTPSLDPRMNGLLYVGQGVPAEEPFGALVFDLFTHSRISLFDRDYSAWRGWGAYDSSAIVAGGFLFRPSENGTIYKLTTDDGISIHSLLRYKPRGATVAAGVESSMAVYANYGYITDNFGSVVCINLDNMHPVWYLNNHDDTDASPVLAIEDGVPMLYVGSAVDKQGDIGYSYLTKINGLTGAIVWRNPIHCGKTNYYGKLKEGGMFSTPLLGRGDCEGILFSNFCGCLSEMSSSFKAIDRTTGKVLYSIEINRYSWSSPVGFLDAEGKMYIVTGNVTGELYLIEARTGRVITTEHVAINFEASPIAVDDYIIIGSRGNKIYKFRLK